MRDQPMTLRLVDEYNHKGHLIYLEDYPGAYVRGRTQDQALAKIPAELSRYHLWTGQHLDPYPILDYQIRQGEKSPLPIEDADTGVLFHSERLPLRPWDYAHLKSLVLKSANDFLSLYQSVPAKDQALKAARQTFYGQMPVTASAMYAHTKGVNRYYFASIGLALTGNGGLQQGREEGKPFTSDRK